MRFACLVAGAVLVASNAVSFGEPKIPCHQTLSEPLESRDILVIESAPAGLHIVGTDQDAIHVSCTAGSHEGAEDVVFHWARTSNGRKLTIGGVHVRHGNNNLEITIEVPHRTSLSVHMFAGEVRVEEVKGDKEIELGAGQITIASIHDGDYRSVNASVGVGEVQARAFGADKGGFFRSFSRKNLKGDYRLRAHVTTGEIDLLGNAERRGEAAKPD